MTVHEERRVTPQRATADELDRGAQLLRTLVGNVERVITGKREVVELVIVALAAGGHVLLEDVPGVGKTMLARSVARSIDASFSRVQGAPDLLPADVTGSSVYVQHEQAFRFVPGPVFANVVLMDELNRTTPRTQAALLEAMEEGQVSVDGTTHTLPAPHLVLATQNPLEHAGTFPLPESQLDRFTIATSVGYPAPLDERDIVRARVAGRPLDQLSPVASPQDVLDLQSAVRSVAVADQVIDYCVRLVTASRHHDRVELGASPRAAIQLVRASQGRALLSGRHHALPDDVQAVARAVLGHRLALHEGTSRITDGDDVVEDLLRGVTVTL